MFLVHAKVVLIAQQVNHLRIDIATDRNVDKPAQKDSQDVLPSRFLLQNNAQECITLLLLLSWLGLF